MQAVALSPPAEPISPELVLVSPPELASLARSLLPEIPSSRRLPAAASPRAALSRARTAVEVTGFTLFCVLATAGPLALVVAART